LFKQLLMVGGLERYFQIARCLRDEDLRADRQFEFMQYDMEMSFAGVADVQAVVTEAVGAAVEAVTGERPGDFSRMTWQDAMDRYGSDKPDIRFGLEITDLAPVFASTGFRAFQAEAVRGIRVHGRGDMGRNKRDGLIDRAKALGAMGLVSFKVEDGALVGNGIQHLSADEQADLLHTLGAVDGDLVLIVAGAPRMVSEVLGALRLDLGRPPVNEGGLVFCWIDDFPLFEGLTDDGSPIPAHHPFSMPHPDDLELLATAISIQYQVGGNLAEVLDSIAFTIRERVRIKGEIRTLTAQQRMSGFVVALLPIGLLAFLFAAFPRFLAPMFVSPPDLIGFPAGMVMLFVGGIMMMVGFTTIRRIVDIDL
jgi:aspartyl-tRNA synthetase